MANDFEPPSGKTWGDPYSTKAPRIADSWPTPDHVFFETLQSYKLQDIGEEDIACAIALTCHLRVMRLFEKIDEAFRGEPFSDKFPPESLESQRRFKAYVSNSAQAMSLFEQTVRDCQWITSLVVGKVASGATPADTKKANGPKLVRGGRQTGAKRPSRSDPKKGGPANKARAIDEVGD